MIDYNKELTKKAKELRKNSTPQENHLWYDFLRGYFVKFQRQKPIDNYIVDFYCHKAKIAIEIDGSQHYSDDGKLYDNNRTKIIESYGIKILRYTNSEINNYFYEVCESIDVEVKHRLK